MNILVIAASECMKTSFAEIYTSYPSSPSYICTCFLWLSVLTFHCRAPHDVAPCNSDTKSLIIMLQTCSPTLAGNGRAAHRSLLSFYLPL